MGANFQKREIEEPKVSMIYGMLFVIENVAQLIYSCLHGKVTVGDYNCPILEGIVICISNSESPQ